MKVLKSRVLQRVLMTILVLCSAVFSLAAQSNDESAQRAGSLIYSSGRGFEIVRNGITEEYDLATDIVEGLEFYTNDYINTFEGTFLEIQVSETTHVLKISENTSFKFNRSAGAESSQYEVTYGRVRARVRKLAGMGGFAIFGPSMVAGIRGTDFGYDVLYNVEDGKTVSSVYCFEGKVEIEATVPLIEAGSEGALDPDAAPVKSRMIELGPNEMVQVHALQPAVGQATEEVRYMLRRNAMAEEIRNFWEINDFKGVPVELETEAKIPEEQDEKHPDEVPPPGLQFRYTPTQLRRSSLLTAGIGTVFGAAALTFAYADPLVGDMDPDVRDNLTLSMGVSAGLFFSTSLFTLFASFF
jgi:hypothetical protein